MRRAILPFIVGLVALSSVGACTIIRDESEGPLPGPIDGTYAFTLLFCNSAFQAFNATLRVSAETGEFSRVDGSCTTTNPQAYEYPAEEQISIDTLDGNCSGSGGNCGTASCGRDADPAVVWSYNLDADGTLNLFRTEDAASGGYCALGQNVVLTGTRQ